MFRPDLVRFLTAAGAEEICVGSIPVLPVHPKPSELCSGIEESPSAFTFTPRRMRLDKDHDLFEDGDIHRHLYLRDSAAGMSELPQAPTVAEFRCHIAGCSQLFDTLESYEHHYDALHRRVCADCKRAFPSDHLLDIHIQEWHDSLFQLMAKKQNMYQCLVEGCDLKFKTSTERKDHLIKVHRYPSDFRFDKTKKNRRPPGGAPQRVEVSMEQGDEPGAGEPMEAEPAVQKRGDRLRPGYSYKVPASICFGQGSVRGFRGGRRRK
uniref:Zinc finger protein 511 n=1 Tax=Paramormyrops kingsleyae TaxID=1676925 RepID=A0A3B3TDA6_9TELE|nr:zinc finger protein 511 isoform X1 [Paramormyrops kingsleyae]